jgi:hypothetical protein
MSLEKAIRSVLINDAGVSAIVGSKVYPQQRPSGKLLPVIVYQTVFQSINQALEAQSGIRRSRLSIEVMDNAYGDTKDLLKAVEDALIDYSGTVEGEIIHSTRLESAVDIEESNDPASQFGTYRTIMDFIIWHEPE